MTQQLNRVGREKAVGKKTKTKKKEEETGRLRAEQLLQKFAHGKEQASLLQ